MLRRACTRTSTPAHTDRPRLALHGPPALGNPACLYPLTFRAAERLSWCTAVWLYLAADVESVAPVPITVHQSPVSACHIVPPQCTSSARQCAQLWPIAASAAPLTTVPLAGRLPSGPRRLKRLTSSSVKRARAVRSPPARARAASRFALSESEGPLLRARHRSLSSLCLAAHAGFRPPRAGARPHALRRAARRARPPGGRRSAGGITTENSQARKQKQTEA